MAAKITIPWRVDDGYAGPDRPHTSTFSVASFDLDATDDELAEEIAQAVQDDFTSSICLSLKTEDVMTAVKAVREAAAIAAKTI